MRRTDREVKNFDDIAAIMEKCDVCRVALNNNGYPYIVPLNFGMRVQDGKIELYFHGAMEGTKYDLIEKDPRAGFEMDCAHQLITDESRGSCTMAYASVAGYGRMEILPDAEKRAALSILMGHYHQEAFPFDKCLLSRTKVFKLAVEHVAGKINRRKTDP